jgi:hypothetical protein
MTEKEFRKWLETFIQTCPECESVLRAIADWNGDDLWRWEKRANLIKEIAGTTKEALSDSYDNGYDNGRMHEAWEE